MKNEDFALDFNVDHTIKNILDGVPGIGKNTKRYTVKASIDQTMAEEIKKMHGINMDYQIRNTLCQEVVMLFQKTSHAELCKITPEYVTLDGMKKVMSKEKLVITNAAVATRLMDDIEYISIKPTSTYNGMTATGYYKECLVYVNALMPFSECKAFIMKENVINMLTASEGIITGPNPNTYTIMIEGEYTISVCENNKHYIITDLDI